LEENNAYPVICFTIKLIKLCVINLSLLISFTDEEALQQEEHCTEFEQARLSGSSAGSSKFYREFDGTTSAKLSRTSKLGHQRILVSSRVMK